MESWLKFGAQIGATIAICWVLFQILLNRYFKVSDEAVADRKKVMEDSIKRVESSNSEVKASVSKLTTEVTELQKIVIKTQVKAESSDEKLKHIDFKLDKVQEATHTAIKEVEKTIMVNLGNDLLLIKTLAQKIRGNK